MRFAEFYNQELEERSDNPLATSTTNTWGYPPAAYGQTAMANYPAKPDQLLRSDYTLLYNVYKQLEHPKVKQIVHDFLARTFKRGTATGGEETATDTTTKPGMYSVRNVKTPQSRVNPVNTNQKQTMKPAYPKTAASAYNTDAMNKFTYSSHT